MGAGEAGDQWVRSLEKDRTVSSRSWRTAFLLSLFLGLFGADRFYTGRIELGMLKLLTFGGYLVWWVVDLVLLWNGRMRDDLGREIRRSVP